MIERNLERGLFASRWLLAPFYVGLVLALAGLLVKFVQELVHFVLTVFSAGESDVVLGVLTLIDLSLAGNLLLIVIFSGYENFVSKFDIGDHEDRPDWHGKVDFGALKMKLIASMVAISGIHLLKVFMGLPKFTEREIMWMTIIHLVFVITGVLLALMDKLSGQTSYEGTIGAGK
ncbi:TIGR00645 family protein [Prosthecomicrobium sp. N25]|uniref:TIGR00645 family protein n=1 Tax=Prosthecomicrobium sp. N25 TaxID=3129254 RepID=UPI0030782E95